ncbi:electron transfer flavoprotein subunit beta/FixA family protein [Clostridium formicaceticum]|uniref:Electron transfer flavoprotein small subunit n=1 Tax=Clostridium formicaceticum TaxID=1497 RepID=A0AAC9WKA6_9CLOT|nr:electron transfer flavoprotein subunit beta/FixA family protein [Clostridium formicaceticum]AOY75222.1 electron transfer flavoprotein subunit beta [Clostridium formicaceticum]ARE89655.1 Acryloyl-CoA reductase electron transfer subunit gamma [Clostridium formicaceticum]
MNILVCIKQVPGTTKVEVDEATGVLKRDGIEAKMNPYDLYAVETALKIKEEVGGEVKVMTMGPPQAEAIIRECFMMGADDGILLSDRKFAGADVLATSYTLAQGVKKAGDFDLIICGKQTTDGDTAQVGAEMAEVLDIAHVANVRKILEINKGNIIVEMDMPTTVEIAEIQLPCLITVEKGIFQPRLPSFKKKLATKNKEVFVYGLKDFGDQNEKRYGLNGSPTQVEKIFPPDTNRDQEIWKGTGEDLALQICEKLKALKFV